MCQLDDSMVRHLHSLEILSLSLSLSDTNNFVRNARPQRRSFATGSTSVVYDAFSLSTGDGVALQPDVEIPLGLSATGPFPAQAGIILDPSLANLVVHDPDSKCCCTRSEQNSFS